MKNVILFSSIVIASGLLISNIYNSLIDSKSWGANIPQSIDIARQYFKNVNPGNFFRVFSPINQLLGLLVLILFWKSSPAIRLNLGIAFALYVIGDVFTFTYFYPRNDIMFRTAQLTEVDTLTKAWSGWNSMNWLRSFILFAGLVFSFLSLHKIYTLK
jgi:hypothetical protein